MVNLGSFFQTGTSYKKKPVIVVLFLISAIIICAFYLQKKTARPNILLITIDALRVDHLGCYGYARNTSPNIDRLAKEGARFTQPKYANCAFIAFPDDVALPFPARHYNNISDGTYFCSYVSRDFERK